MNMPTGFTGGLHDRDTGLMRFGYRDYDPDTGRWTAKDPILFAGGDTDLFGYCVNDPVNMTDPTGKVAAADDSVIILGLLIIATYHAIRQNAGAIADDLKKIWDRICSEAKKGEQDSPWVADCIPYNPGKDSDGRCIPCEDSPIFYHEKQKTHPCRGHQIRYRQDSHCNCFPYRFSF